jgi:TRAP transporter TAXI family solute receptor
MRVRVGEALAFVVLSCLLVGVGSSQTARAQDQKRLRAPTSAETGETSKVQQINNWTVGLAGGLPEGTFIRFGAEIARNLNDPEEMRVLPVITQGATDNVKDLLYLRGIDVAITNADVLDYFKNTERIPNIEKRINFVSEMVISEVHLVVRPEINSIKDLEGKKVSLGAKGAGQSTTGPIVFKRLGVNPEFVYVNNAIALEQMKTGEVVAIVNNGAKPLDLLTKFNNDAGFKFLPIPIDRFDEYYIPATLTAQDYPGYIKPGEKVETLGVQTVLAVYNWPRESDRYRRVQRFIERYFDMFDKFHAPPYHPKWKSVNLAANVPGWIRYVVAEEKLKSISAAKQPAQVPVAASQGPQRAVRTGGSDAADQEKLFQQFLEWSKKQGKR